MRKLLTITLWISLIFILVSLTPDIIPPCDSPVVGDHSGAPGETNCSACHSSPVNPDIPDLQFQLESADSTYQFGKVYTVQISIRKTNHDKFGFVCTSLDSLNKTQGMFGVIDAANTRKFSSGGRSYISHTPCGADSKDSIRWSYKWTAPATNKGKIKIYMALLVANHDHGLGGDTTYTRILGLEPDLSTDLKNINSFQKVKVYPSIINKEIIVDFGNNDISERKEIELFNISGVSQAHWQILESKVNLDVDLVSGIYLLKVKYKNHCAVFRILKP
ncbi:MAG: T9SS type A sorting domain-containing protein [Saprospiraceae bacterium]|uniref:T9SS type A sorting domain-containing protein n=1 Tax=Candidatus Defluviibacterium haderslevense TaxID=2981993 RepID=A0A9D7XGQ0_9BACT|nr:T9SS type A sorting domain-containing protein [Candidatus Defluviibacterium haderslevense]